VTTLFDPVIVGKLAVPNRVVMAPMTRSRAGVRGTATALMGVYYAQRASAGLIISESIQCCAAGQSAIATPGLHSGEQVESWRQITRAVHAAGGRIFAQLMHAGRVSHPDVLPDGLAPVAPSAIVAKARTFTQAGLVDCPVPAELTVPQIGSIVAAFARSARGAAEAGFDGVEVHGANGYLINQFLSASANRRTDAYGGSVRNRIRFAVAVAEAVAQEIGPERVGYRISPWNDSFGIEPGDDDVLYQELVRALPTDLAYLHLREVADRRFTARLRHLWDGPMLLNPHPGGLAGGPVTERIAQQALEEGVAELISFGSLYIANPDLPERIKAGGPYAQADRATLYGGGPRGYTSYPPLQAGQGWVGRPRRAP
jgi:N-ethylmaleimide reductase